MFDWEDFINLAYELIQEHNTNYDEALYRTIISRAYYGIFKQVEDYLKLRVSLPNSDYRGRKLGSHERVIFFLQTHKNPKVKEFGDILEDLKRLRHKADYNAKENIGKDEATRAVEDALDLSEKWNTTIINLISENNTEE